MKLDKFATEIQTFVEAVCINVPGDIGVNLCRKFERYYKMNNNSNFSPTMSYHQVKERISDLETTIHSIRFPGGCPNPVKVSEAQLQAYETARQEKAKLINIRDNIINAQ